MDQHIPDPTETPAHKKNHVFWFSLCFCVILIIIELVLQNDKTRVEFFPVVFIFFFIVMYACNINKKGLAEPADYLKPLFIAIAISFAIVHLTFGVHDEAISSYDNETSNSRDDRYKWFKVDEVLTLPISQLNFKSKPIPKTIEFDTLKENTPTDNIIVADKTKSIIEPKHDSLLKDSMAHYIKDHFKLMLTENDLEKYYTSELTPLFIIGGLIENSSQRYSNDNISILYYKGHKSDDDLSDMVPKKNIREFGTYANDTSYVTGYLRKVLETRPRGFGQQTSFNEIMEMLGTKLKGQAKDVNISMISDFLNTNSKDTIPDLSKIKNAKGLDLYMFNGYEPKNLKVTALELINKMIKRFRYRHRSSIVNFKDANLDGADEVKNFFENHLRISNLQVFDPRYGNNIPFYSPFIDFQSDEAAVANVSFRDSISDNSGDLYYFRVYDLDNPGAELPINYNLIRNNYESKSDTTVFPGEIYQIDAKQNDLIRISLPYAFRYRNDRLFIDISSHRRNKTSILPISIRPLLPETTSYYLFFFYTIFVVSISFMLILPNLFVFWLIALDKIQCRRRDSVVLAIPVAVGIAFLIYYLSILYSSHKDLLLTFFPVFLVTIAFTIPSFVYDVTFAKNETATPTFEPWAFLTILRKAYDSIIRSFGKLLD